MIVAIDIGNTRVKARLIDKNLNIIEKKSWSTPDLFEPDRWNVFFEELDTLNPLFSISEKRISCVSWRAFLALRVYFGYDLLDHFNPNKEFNTDLMILPLDSPFVFETMIPLDTTYMSGLIGTDRLLSGYAANRLFHESMVVVNLGTATTIDLITNAGIFLGGAILPGVDVAYSGLLSRATHLPPLSQLPDTDKSLGNSTLHSLSVGAYIAHAAVIEALYIRQKEEANLQSSVGLLLTGGRHATIGAHMRLPFMVKDDLVSYGLALMPSWQKTVDQINTEHLQEDYHPKNFQSIDSQSTEKSTILSSDNIQENKR